MTFAEVLDEIPKLSFAERQEPLQRAISLDDDDSNETENAILDARMEDFKNNPDEGMPLEQLKEHVQARLNRR